MPSLPTDPAELLSAIVASSDDAIISKDLDGIVTSWNRGAERIFGYTAEEMIGRSIRTIVPAERQSEEDEVLRKIRNGQSVDHFETIRRRKDGTYVPISLTVSPVRSGGRIVGASKVARDISERWRADAAIAEAGAAEADLQQRLLALVAASGSLLESPRITDVIPATLRLAAKLVPADAHAIWRLDAKTNVWSIGAYSGISPEFASKIIDSYQGRPAGVIPSFEPLVFEDIQTAPLLDERRELLRAEGIQSIIAIPLAIRGQLTGTLVFYYRKRHHFTDVEVQTARALGNLSAGAMTTAELYDEQQRSHERATFLAQASTAVARSLNYPATLKTVATLAVPHVADWCAVDLIGDDGQIERLAFSHVDPAKLEFAREFLKKYPEPNSPYTPASVIESGKPAFIERITDEMIVAAAKNEDHLRDLRRLELTSLMVVPLIARGRTLGTMTFATAESGRRYSEADLRFGEDLALRAALAVDNARAYEEARRANRLKDDFLATLSHELRTPLNAILGYARMLRTGVMSAERQVRAVEIVERSASSLTQIVEDVLDVARITSGKLRLNLQPVQLPSVVNDAVGTMQPAADVKGITIGVHIDPAVGTVRADADRLQQVVWNLVSNAVKFTPSGGRVDVRVETQPGHVVISVTDTGIGFPQEFAPHLFERFRQADSGFARKHGGLGLGLAIARHLVELLGGTIDAFSEGKGKGATFRVVLPVAARQERAFVEPPRRLPSGAKIAPVLAGLDGIHVIAVDDDPDALSLVREILEAAGASVTTATSAETALAELARVRADLLIADLGMPAVDGFELIARVRQSSDPDVRDIPAVALTAYARSEERTRALKLGFQLHLAKPIDPVELVAAVVSVARQPRATAS